MRAEDPRVLIVLPAWNEASNLPALFAELGDSCSGIDVLVVNDGSTDDTALVARQLGATVVSLPINLGIGAAVQTGLLYATQNGYDAVVRLDSDGQHPPSEVPRLLAALNSEWDVVVGSRFLGERSYRSSWMRRLGIRWLRLLIRVVTGLDISDCTSGFCAYGPAAAAFLARHYPVDYPEPESMVLLAGNGFRVREIAVRMRERQSGRSSINGLKTLYYMVKVSLAVLVEAFRRPLRQ